MQSLFPVFPDSAFWLKVQCAPVHFGLLIELLTVITAVGAEMLSCSVRWLRVCSRKDVLLREQRVLFHVLIVSPLTGEQGNT